MDDEVEPARWGTWEELVLGQAVVRHGTDAWVSVASEVQTRTTLFPLLFTPEECKAKYQGLLERFGDRDELLNDLRKLRIKELRREIEKSECSIGSLQTILGNLNAVKQEDDLDHDTCRLESLPLADNMQGRESTGREKCMEGSSAGSFTECIISRDSSLVCQVPATKARESEDGAVEVKLELPEDITGISRTLKKRRGRRKRKECIEMRDGGGGTGESEVLSSANTHYAKVNDKLAVDHDKIKAPDRCIESVGQKFDFLPRVLDFILEHKDAEVISWQNESQRRVRYKKLIKRHIDLEMIKRRIEEKSYTTSLEMKRDLLLLLNNVLVYYSRGSPDYNSAITLRKLVTEKFREFTVKDQVGTMLLRSPAPNPVKPRSSRPRKHEAIVKADTVTLQMGSVGKSGKDASLKRKKSDEQFPFVKGKKNDQSVERNKSDEEPPFVKGKKKNRSLERKKSDGEFSFLKAKDDKSVQRRNTSEKFSFAREKKNDKSIEKANIDEEFPFVKEKNDISVERRNTGEKFSFAREKNDKSVENGNIDEEFRFVKEKNDRFVEKGKTDEEFPSVKEKKNYNSVAFAKNSFGDTSFTTKATIAPFFKTAKEFSLTAKKRGEMASIVRKRKTRFVSFIKDTSEDLLLKKKTIVQGVTKPSLPVKRPANAARKNVGGGKQLKISSVKGRKR